ncbi:hypothetical protein L873DRAFT_1814992 [Choiromyces venosus 120613-1]|uniref:Uncharacterized protein n=1 Tax=Choiromyces venosus 120613-1 TaxID=1336337 RepID=A0A3N4J6Z1_9PEZI|nr:hypothetical protein L873DRAFT_1814992 [Choiromyces venosus 120613-1]
MFDLDYDYLGPAASPNLKPATITTDLNSAPPTGNLLLKDSDIDALDPTGSGGQNHSLPCLVKRTVGQTHGHPVRAISYPLIPTIPQRAITLAPLEATLPGLTQDYLSRASLFGAGSMPPLSNLEPPHSIAREKFPSNHSESAELLFLANKCPRRLS